ncbi:MAG: ATP-binding protein [Acidobacteriota bacterium]
MKVYAVFDRDPQPSESGTFVGLVPGTNLPQVADHRFADLVPRPAPPPVRITAGLDEVLDRMNDSPSGVLPVQDDAGLFVGAITWSSLGGSLLSSLERAEAKCSRAEETLKLRTEQLQAIVDATVIFMDKRNWWDVAALLTGAARTQTESELGFAGIVEQGPSLKVLAQRGVARPVQREGRLDELALRAYRDLGHLEFDDFQNLFGRVVADGRPVLLNDLRGPVGAGDLPPPCPPLRHFLAVPMLKGTDSVGLIAVANRPGGYSVGEQARLEILTGIASILYEFHWRQKRERTLEEQLRQSQRMEALGRLAGSVAHDFNNILTVIMGHSLLLRRRLPRAGKLRRHVDEIRRAGERSAALTHQLLTFTRRQALEPRVLNLNDIVNDVLPMLRRVIGEDIDFDSRLEPALGHVRTDPGQLEQIIMNLVVNARDAMPDGGRLTLETSNVELDRAYATRRIVVRPGPYVMLAVADSGQGMSAEVQARVFEPFFTTKEIGRGTGLGLSTVYGIVKQSGGYIWVYSEPGYGTTFKIYLPRVSAPKETGRPSRARGALPRGTETLLLVEDDHAVRSLTREILAAHGYTVPEARDGAEAIEICRRHSGDIHLLLTDVVMPCMNGRDLARHLAGLRPGIKVVYMSGYTGHTVARHGVLDVGVPYLQKPFTVEALLSKVREVLGAP